jgi:hypothetical protein
VGQSSRRRGRRVDGEGVVVEDDILIVLYYGELCERVRYGVVVPRSRCLVVLPFQMSEDCKFIPSRCHERRIEISQIRV